MKTSELTGAHLDYWVARAEGILAEQLTIRRVQRSTEYHVVFEPSTLAERLMGWKVKRYSTDWAQGGPLIERHNLEVYRWNEEWEAWCNSDEYCRAETPLIAICRAVVRSVFGDEVKE